MPEKKKDNAAGKLNEKAMLAKFNVKRWTAVKEDQRVTAQVAKDNGADATMGRYVKRLVVKQALKAISVIGYRARHYHYEHTMPWADNGARILPATAYFDYMKEMKAFQRQFEREVAKFVGQYDAWVKDAKVKLGGLYNADEYPTKEEIGKIFSMTCTVEGLPNADDFRVDLGAEETAKVRASIEAEVNARLTEAVRDNWRRIHDRVQHLTEKLREYDPADKGAAPFRDATIENIKILADLLPGLNITGSAELAAMAKRLDDELCKVDPATLRESPAAREDVAKKADAILKDVGDVLA